MFDSWRWFGRLWGVTACPPAVVSGQPVDGVAVKSNRWGLGGWQGQAAVGGVAKAQSPRPALRLGGWQLIAARNAHSFELEFRPWAIGSPTRTKKPSRRLNRGVWAVDASRGGAILRGFDRMGAIDDELVDKLAARQLGLVTRAQLQEHGMSPRAIAGRVRAKRLRLVHRGVYRVGPLVVPHARELAAVLACGAHAVLSHRSAGWLWQLLPDPGDAEPVDVSIGAGNRGRRRPHVRVHRVSLGSEDVTRLREVPITSPTRTLVDLSGVLSARALENVLALALRANLVDPRALHGVAGRPGAPLLRALLANETGPALTRSEAEHRFLALIRKAQLPVPESNVRVGDYEVDFLWRREGVVAEVDGFAFHSSQRRFESDRRRDTRLTAIGLRVLRVTWRQVVHEPEAMLVQLAQILARGASTGAAEA